MSLISLIISLTGLASPASLIRQAVFLLLRKL